jgi:hypothetical protein
MRTLLASLALLVATSGAPKLSEDDLFNKSYAQCPDNTVLEIKVYIKGNEAFRSFGRGTHLVGIEDMAEAKVWVERDKKWYTVDEVVAKYGSSACDLPDGLGV